jgi:protein-S-isoprenylcysteine O-methyltransferase Ste14
MSFPNDAVAYDGARDGQSGARAGAEKAVPRGVFSRIPVRLLERAERVIFIVALVLFCLANLRAHQIVGLMIVATDAAAILFLLFQRSTDQMSRSVSDWTVALFGTFGGMLMRPGGAPLVPAVVVLVLTMEGVAIELAAKLSLNRRFGVAAANRGIQDRWAYRFVRHPMYLGYLLLNTAYLLFYPTWLNLAVWCVTWACQIARIFAEERFLLSDPVYQAYAGRVRFRLFPLLF